jgi:hypothetical protein
VHKYHPHDFGDSLLIERLRSRTGDRTRGHRTPDQTLAPLL